MIKFLDLKKSAAYTGSEDCELSGLTVGETIFTLVVVVNFDVDISSQMANSPHIHLWYTNKKK